MKKIIHIRSYDFSGGPDWGAGKWGRDTTVKSGKISPKVERLLHFDDKSPQTMLTTYKIRLAAQCTKLRTNLNARQRFHNNKLHRYKVKALYSKLRYGDSPGVKAPPPLTHR